MIDSFCVVGHPQVTTRSCVRNSISASCAPAIDAENWALPTLFVRSLKTCQNAADFYTLACNLSLTEHAKVYESWM